MRSGTGIGALSCTPINALDQPTWPKKPLRTIDKPATQNQSRSVHSLLEFAINTAFEPGEVVLDLLKIHRLPCSGEDQGRLPLWPKAVPIANPNHLEGYVCFAGKTDGGQEFAWISEDCIAS